MKRESLGSRLGFILLSAGCAIGIGNVWKFPSMVGKNGGAIFVLVYLFFLAILGIPVMTMEFAMGRASRKSPVCMYQELEQKGHKWHIHGYAAMFGNYLLMMFYTSVTAWLLQYFVKMATGAFVGLNKDGVEAVFDAMTGDAGTMILYMGIVVVIGFGVCAIGLQNGLEKITKYMMLLLLGLMVVLAVNSITMDGGEEGLKFYLIPDINRMLEEGVGNVIVGAMNQAFFTLSLGVGSMAIFGSYINKNRSLMGEAVNVGVLDTFVAFCSGLIIFPACYAYGVKPDEGPSLIFKTLPNIFNNFENEKAGMFWGSLFFIFLSFAALSTIFAVFENIISCTRDLTGWSRKKACLINGIAIFILSIPCILGFSVWKDVQIADKNIMDMEDFVVSNLLLPIGSLLFVLFCTTRYGWGWDKFLAEANEGKGLKVAKWMRPYMTFVLPVIILVLLIVGLIPSKG
ncbi:MAG: sodium-dependent transporter [Lachnospiraceae bacterium]|nr:sodium-dependent transporter [Lachnospiraceae bacterium]